MIICNRLRLTTVNSSNNFLCILQCGGYIRYQVLTCNSQKNNNNFSVTGFSFYILNMNNPFVLKLETIHDDNGRVVCRSHDR